MAPNDNKRSRSLYTLAWYRLKRNKLAMFGLSLIGVALFIAILGSYLRPDPTEHANDQNLSLARKKPGFTVDLLHVAKNQEVLPTYFWERLFFGGINRKHRSQPVKTLRIEGDTVSGAFYTGKQGRGKLSHFGLHLADVVYPLASRDIRRQGDTVLVDVLGAGMVKTTIGALKEKVRQEHIETRTYWLGTDKFGRDLLSRLMAGTIVSLSVGAISVIISLVIGLTLGAIAGYFKGWVDDVIMYLINVTWSIPALLFVIAIVVAMGKGFSQVFIAVGLIMWVEVARIVRGQVLSMREKEFVEAGRALGYRPGRLIVKHVIPNVMGPVIVISAANFATAILVEAGLSYLGIGAQIPVASWGSMIKNHYSYITTDMAYLAILPGICIMLLVLAFMLVGNGLRDALDTKTMDELNTGA